MKITAISDLHGFLPKLDGGDLLIIAGDVTAHDNLTNYMLFYNWLEKQQYKKKIYISGNHDGLHHRFKIFQSSSFDGIYLCDSGIEFEGLKIWGAPWTPYFECDHMHFMLHRGNEIKKKWDLIPRDTDILVTHSPPYSILDETDDNDMIGSEDLYFAVKEICPKIHIFGHCHESYGQLTKNKTLFVNASIMTACYDPKNKPINIEI